jgi:hypothetical protein
MGTIAGKRKCDSVLDHFGQGSHYFGWIDETLLGRAGGPMHFPELSSYMARGVNRSTQGTEKSEEEKKMVEKKMKKYALSFLSSALSV